MPIGSYSWEEDETIEAFQQFFDRRYEEVKNASSLSPFYTTEDEKEHGFFVEADLIYPKVDKKCVKTFL